MTSKERVLTAFAHREPDRVPVNYASNPGVHRRLEAHFRGRDVLEALGVDFRGVGVSYAGPPLHPEVPGRRVDPEWGSRTRWIEHGSGGYWDFCDFPLRDADEEAVAAWPMPSPDDYDYTHVLEQCRREEAFAVHLGDPGLGDFINSTGFLCHMERVLEGLFTDDPAILRLIDRKLAIRLEVTRRTLEAARGGIDFVWLGEDLGAQNLPLISLDLFRRHLRPRHQQFIDLARSFRLPVMVHTCGSSSWAYEDFVEMGVTAVDTLQPEARNMSPGYLKAKFGGRLAFHGCISTAGPVAFGTPEEVAASVRETLEIMMPGGGYCLAPTHQLQDNSPTENVLALYAAAHRFGRYRIKPS
jgi:hypothetical protein